MLNIAANSEQLKITALSDDDEALYCAVMSNPSCMLHVGAQLTPSEAVHSFNAALELTRQQPVRRCYLKVTMRCNDEPIGIAAINQLDLTSGTADIGRILLPTWHGKGLGTELGQLLINWLHGQFNITCFSKHIRVANHAAIQSALKLGFKPASLPKASDNNKVQKYLLYINTCNSVKA